MARETRHDSLPDMILTLHMWGCRRVRNNTAFDVLTVSEMLAEVGKVE
jgi:hypothetical protein